ncbi:MAG: hypothetical protein HY756_06910 [Nitrospirae bacterium]|nr:hypothetical protein [Nitrospirota bacterium]
MEYSIATNNLARIKKSDEQRTNSKYQKIIEALKSCDIINENSNAKVTIKFNYGGILYIEVEDKKILK